MRFPGVVIVLLMLIGLENRQLIMLKSVMIE